METEKTKKPKVKYEGEFKQFGARKGRVMDAVLKDVKAHEVFDNTSATITERVFKSNVLGWENEQRQSVNLALDLLVAVNRVERKPVGNSCLYKGK